MSDDAAIGFPEPTADERELYLRWLRFLRGAVLRKAEGVSADDARWTPDGKLISLIGIVNHLTGVEWRWIDGAMLGREVGKSPDEYRPGPDLRLEDAVSAYRARAEATDAFVLAAPSLGERGAAGDVDLRWVLLHLINETARHAGHADATRELLDGTTGE